MWQLILLFWDGYLALYTLSQPRTRPFFPPVPGLDELPFLDNERLLALRELPSRLVIIGGGYISLEMAQIFRRLGSEVAILETGPRLTAREDEDIAAAVTGMLTAEGIEVNTGVRIERVGKADNDAGRLDRRDTRRGDVCARLSHICPC